MSVRPHTLFARLSSIRTFKLLFVRLISEQGCGCQIPLLTRGVRQGKVLFVMPRVLIIQDDPAVLALMRHGLVRRGYEVDSVRSAHEALDRLKTVRPDLVVSDVQLEDARGDLLLGAVGAHFPEVACLLVTSGPTSRSSFGGISVLRKPWDIVHFVDRVCTELDKRAARIQADTGSPSVGRASVS